MRLICTLSHFSFAMGALQLSHKLDYEAVLRPSRWASGMQVIGAVPDYVAAQLHLPSAARSVWLHEQTVIHISDRRNMTPVDSEFVFEHMPAAVLRPTFCGVEQRGDAVRLSLAEFIRPAGRYMYLAAKLARGGDGRDELWVSAAYPMSEGTLRRYLRCGRLAGVVGRTLEGGKTRTARRFFGVAARV
ncbi:MAG: hypothetical protein NVS4B3_22250 [Gemmatimonadaceae bacterium]